MTRRIDSRQMDLPFPKLVTEMSRDELDILSHELQFNLHGMDLISCAIDIGLTTEESEKKVWGEFKYGIRKKIERAAKEKRESGNVRDANLLEREAAEKRALFESGPYQYGHMKHLEFINLHRRGRFLGLLTNYRRIAIPEGRTYTEEEANQEDFSSLLGAFHHKLIEIERGSGE